MQEFFIDNLLVRIQFIVVMTGWTGLAPWEFEFPFPDSLTSTFLDAISLAIQPPDSRSELFGPAHYPGNPLQSKG